MHSGPTWKSVRPAEHPVKAPQNQSPSMQPTVIGRGAEAHLHCASIMTLPHLTNLVTRADRCHRYRHDAHRHFMGARAVTGPAPRRRRAPKALPRLTNDAAPLPVTTHATSSIEGAAKSHKGHRACNNGCHETNTIAAAITAIHTSRTRTPRPIATSSPIAKHSERTCEHARTSSHHREYQAGISRTIVHTGERSCTP